MVVKATPMVGPDSPVVSLKGIGPSKAAALARLGISTIRDLVLHLPRHYLDLRNPDRLDRCSAGGRVTVLCRLDQVRGSVVKGKGLYVVSARITCSLSGARGTARWYANYGSRPPVWLAKRLVPGQSYILRGVAEAGGKDGTVINGPAVTPWSPEDRDAAGMLPVYPGTAGIRQGELARLVRAGLDALPDPDDGLGTLMGMSLRGALAAVHAPSDPCHAEQGRRRLALAEFCSFRFHRGCGAGAKAPDLAQGLVLVDSVIAGLPFALTDGQGRAWNAILTDLRSGLAMDRLLQGDVGCGKTVVAALACAMAIGAGYQVAVLSPTEVLANQLYTAMGGFLGEGRVRLLTASTDTRSRRRLLSELGSGAPLVVVGTHSLLSADVAFDKLALAILDEQHRFGVGQRQTLLGKGSGVHCLSLSATPIPRSLALGLFGDLGITTIDTVPPGRTPVGTRWVPVSSLPSAYAFVAGCLKAGGRAYVLCPSIDEAIQPDPDGADVIGNHGEGETSPEGPDTSVEAQAEAVKAALSGVVDPGAVGVLHGRMPQAAKDAAMKGFSHGSTRVLVCTTVVEVGVDVPEANAMVILGADRFGLAQLHQLRGRVGRGTLRSHCVLVSDGGTPMARERLEALRGTNDGFALAEMDLALRGPGELAGMRQHGVPDFRVLSFPKDIGIIEGVDHHAVCARPDQAMAWFPFGAGTG